MLRTMTGGEFARRLSAAVKIQDKRYAFFLGAGCSVSSGIPAAGSLVTHHWLPLLRELVAPHSADDSWITELIDDFDASFPAASYGAVIEHLFRFPEDRQREIERLCEGRFPGFGYGVLAGLMAHDTGNLNVALTTNFDDLLSDAMYLFALARPLVIQHETLAGFIRPTRSRPLVVKLHGDHRLTPRNTSDETARLTRQFEQSVPALLHDRGLIFLGYGGGDRGIAEMLRKLPVEALPLGVYWVSGSEPLGEIRPWLDERSAIWVNERDFDAMMLMLRDTFDLAHPTAGRFDDVFTRYRQTYEKLTERISLHDDQTTLRDAINRADEAASPWWRAALAARRARQGGDFTRARQIYEEAIADLGEIHGLLGDYANFLADDVHDLALAEKMYKRAIEAAPDVSRHLNNYAIFLSVDRPDPDLAKDYYERAITADPLNAHALGSYAWFLATTHRDMAAAEMLYRRALEADPVHANNVADFAGFLFARGELDEGERLARQAERLAADDPRHPLHVEVAFYRWANGPDAEREAARDHVETLLAEGIRSFNANFDLNIEAAARSGRDVEPLRELASAIAKNPDREAAISRTR